MDNHYFTKATQLALKTAFIDPDATKKVLDLSQFRGKHEVVFRTATENDCFSYFMLDVTLDENQQWRLIEANGSNAALSSTAVGGEIARVEHLVQLFLSKQITGKVVVLFAHQFQFIHLGEFFNRAALFAQLLSSHYHVALIGTDEEPGSEEVTIVAGEINAIAMKVKIQGTIALYMDLPITIASNPNLLPELQRLHITDSMHKKHPLNINIFQEQCCTLLVHNKSAQQDCCVDTGIVPIKYIDASNLPQCLEAIAAFNRLGKTAVAKMNAGSGGTGIEFFESGLSNELVQRKLDHLFSSVRKKYTTEADYTMFPIRFFEFVKSRPLQINDAPHLWDLRMQVIVHPKKVEIRPCVVRACPKPFDGSYTKSTVVNNLSGRTDAKDLAAFMFMNPYYKNSIIHRFLNIPDSTLEQLNSQLSSWATNAIIKNEAKSDNKLDLTDEIFSS